MKPTKVTRLLSEDALAEIEHVTIRLESGKVAKFNIAKELSVSSDPDRMFAEALTAHSRFAFWEYQASRAQRMMREREIELARIEGDLRYRIGRVMKGEDQYTSSAAIEGVLNGDKGVLAARNELTELREHWTILRTVASAHDHRAHLLRRLLARDQDAARG